MTEHVQEKVKILYHQTEIDQSLKVKILYRLMVKNLYLKNANTPTGLAIQPFEKGEIILDLYRPINGQGAWRLPTPSAFLSLRGQLQRQECLI